jgi:hypothetical protein
MPSLKSYGMRASDPGSTLLRSYGRGDGGIWRYVSTNLKRAYAVAPATAKLPSQASSSRLKASGASK